MNTLKKTVAVVLAVAMVLTMGIATSFAAYTDVPSTEAYAEAVNILSNLGIFTGYTDGSFKPNNTITRSEAAAIIVRVLDLPVAPGETPFTDVAADNWAAGYINTAYSKGIVNGRGNGIFDPTGDVTYEEIVKMIVCALGREPEAADNGGWSMGYLSVANATGVTKSSGGKVGQPATRATVAKLVYNALDVDMMERKSYGSEARYEIVEGKTLLSGLGVEKVNVVVESSYLTDAAKGDYDAENRTVQLSAAKNNTEYDGETYKKGEIIPESFYEGGTAAAALLGRACVAYLGLDDETDEHTIYAISAKGSSNSSTIVTSAQLADPAEYSNDEATKDADGYVYYWKNSTDRRASSIEPDSDGITVYVNYVVDDTYVYVGKKDSDNTPGSKFYDELSKLGGVIEFIDNDGDGKYNIALVSKYSNEGIVESVRVNNKGNYVFTAKYGKVPTTYDPEDENVLKLFVKGENYIDPSEIAEGDTITAIGDDRNETNKLVIYKVSSDKIEGKSSSYDDVAKTLTVAGKPYSGSPLYTDGIEKKNTNGVFYLNADGAISYIDGTASVVGDYGYLLGVDESGKFGRNSYEVEILDAATGTVKVYGVKSNVTVYAKGTSTKKTAKEAYDEYLADIAGEDAPIDNSVENFKSRVIKYTIENNELSKIVLADQYDEDVIEVKEFNRMYDADDRTIGSSDPFTDNTLVFLVSYDDETEANDADCISVVRGGRFTDRTEYHVVTFSEDEVVAAAIQFSEGSIINKSEPVFVVSNVAYDMNDDDENIVIFKGYQNGTPRTFQLYDDEEGLADKIADGDYVVGKGSILLVGPEANGTVDTIEILVRVVNGRPVDKIYTDIKTQDTYDKKKIMTDLVEMVPDIDTDKQNDSYYFKGGKIQLAGYDVDEYDEVALYAPTKKTNIVVVDFSNNLYRNASVSLGSLTDVDVASSDYTLWAFFRAYDVDDYTTDISEVKSDVQDLVIYKFNNDTYDNSIIEGANDDDSSSTSSVKAKPSTKWNEEKELDLVSGGSTELQPEGSYAGEESSEIIL